jgi:cytochrome b subunit of formate dehydrogenase
MKNLSILFWKRYLVNSVELVYYLGVLGIMFVVGYLLFVTFEEYDEIKLEEHIWMIVMYIIVLISVIIVWRLMFNFIFELQDFMSSKNSVSIEDYK